MNITNRKFVYPVLSEEKDDYKESLFNVDFENSMDGVNGLKLTFDIVITCPELEQMILTGLAEYVIHLECSTTTYREVLKTVSKHVEHVIPIGRVSGSLEIVAFEILKKGVSNFTCKDWVDDYAGISFSLSQGTILAYQNLPCLDITKDYEEFINAGSIFSIYKRITDEDKPAEISLESAKIKIGLGTKDYEVYSIYSSKIEIQSLFHSMLILPVLVYVFEELKQDDGQETYHGKEWFIALEKAYAKRGSSFMNEVLNTEKTSYQLAQEAMELPLSKAFDQIPVFFSSGEED